MRNALTIDLEDYYHVSAFRDSNPHDQWEFQRSRIERNTALLIDLLDEVNCKATFFALGWIAQKYPSLVRTVADRGHEIACHSFHHRIVYEMTEPEFREDSRVAKQLLEDCSGMPVRGYRAPSFSITANSLWALNVLADLGFEYDSSIFPAKHPNYGMPEASRGAFCVRTPSGPIVEFPLTTLQMGVRRSPLAGGAYFRSLPYWYTRWGIRFLNSEENRPVCVYLHPWELDPAQPRLRGSLTARLRHYVGLRSTPTKFRKLIRDFAFCPLSELVHGFQISSYAAAEVAPEPAVIRN